MTANAAKANTDTDTVALEYDLPYPPAMATTSTVLATVTP